MRFANLLIFIFSGLAVVLPYGVASADDLKSNELKTLAVVSVKGGNIDNRVYHQFDRLVPELKKISTKKVVKLECRYFGQPDRESDVENAYKLTSLIEKYLRIRHKLDLDIWVAVDVKPIYAKSSPVLTMAVFLDDIKKLDTVLVNPSK